MHGSCGIWRACQPVGYYYYLLFLWGNAKGIPKLYDTFEEECGKEVVLFSSMWVKLLLPIIHDGPRSKYRHKCVSTGWCVWSGGGIFTC